jgi:O-antigen ligase
MSTQVIETWKSERTLGGRPRCAGTADSISGIRAGRVTRTRLALLAAAVSFPIWAMSPLAFIKFGDIKFEYVMGIAITMAGVALIEGLGRGGFGYRASPWLWGLGVLLLIGLVASLIASDSVVAVNGNDVRRDGFLMMLFNATLFLTAYRTAQSAVTSELCEIVSRCVVAAAVPVWGYALAQGVGFDPYRWEAFRGAGGRVFSTLGNPIFLGAYSAMVALLALGLWMQRTSRWGFVWLLAAGLGASVTALSAARAAWIGLVVGLVALAGVSVRGTNLTRMLRGFAVACVFACVAAGIILVVAPDDRMATLRGTAASLSSPVDSRNSGRLAIWAISARMIADHPLLGVGPDLMGSYFEEYRTRAYDRAEGADRVADKPHGSVLEWAVETGLPAAALFSALCAGILFVVGRILLRASSRRGSDRVVAGIWAAATAYALQSLVTVTAIGVDGVWWVLLGLLAGWSVARPTHRIVD